MKEMVRGEREGDMRGRGGEGRGKGRTP